MLIIIYKKDIISLRRLKNLIKRKLSLYKNKVKVRLKLKNEVSKYTKNYTKLVVFLFF